MVSTVLSPRRMWRFAALVVALLLAIACSGRTPNRPTEAALHSGDVRPAGSVTDTHVFVCRGGYGLLVEFGRGAPTISVRATPASTPMVFTAAANGLPYERAGNRAVVEGDELRNDLVGGSHRTCTRQTKG